MNRISIRLLHCLGASVATPACIALSPLAAAATDATATGDTIVTAPSGEAPTTPASPNDAPAPATPSPTPTPEPSATPTEPAPPITGHWVRQAAGWRYEFSDGTWLKGGVHAVGATRYAFTDDGYVPVGWYRSPEGTWYASTEDGVRTGWHHDGAAWYYLDGDGSMATGWRLSGGAWYYLDPTRGGAMATGWAKDGNTWYYMDASGAMKSSTWVREGAWYYLTGSGAMATGWFIADGSWYYADGSGAMRTGWLNDSGTWYYLHPSGAMGTGWIQEGSSWYYLNPNAGGAMATGWAAVGGAWNYFDRWKGFWVSGRADFEADWNYAKTLYSPTNYLVVVDTGAPHCMTFYWAEGTWQPLTDMPCSVGKASTPTATGTFTIKNRGSSFGHGYTAYWWTQFYGDYLFHSVLYYEGSYTVKDGTLGGHVSHGCVRLRYEDAKWLHDTIPSGTYVTIY